jgi:cytochrome P450
MYRFKPSSQRRLIKYGSISYARAHLNTPIGMSIEELEDTCVQITLAGSETTASLLSAVVYYLLINPSILDTLVKEIRTTFHTEDEINMARTSGLKYELAVIEEGLRIFPPGK